MASVRELKKDVDNLIFELISDCFVYGGVHFDNNADEVSEIISDAVSLRNDLITRINHPVKNDDHKAVKSHYRLVKRDLYIGVDKLFERLSALSKQKK